jgi:hypothetical protein
MEIILPSQHIVLIDDEDFELVSKYRWFVHYSHRMIYARGYLIEDWQSKQKQMHRLILGVSSKEQIDHKNRNGLDNRRKNLRIANPSQQNYNKDHWGKKNRFKGVHKLPSGRFRAFGRQNGKQIHLGVFDTEIEAAKTYDEFTKEIAGEFAKLNLE